MKPWSEAAFQDQITNLADLYGWRWFHAPDNLPRTTRSGRRAVQRVRPGFPDLVLVRAPELIFAEVKTQVGRVRPEQQEWLEALEVVARRVAALTAGSNAAADRAAHVEVYLWRPGDFDEIHARLARGRHRLEPTYREPTS